MDFSQIFDRIPQKLEISHRLKKAPLRRIDAEETFSDITRSGHSKIEIPISRRNFFLLFGFVILIFTVLGIKACWMQIFEGSNYFSQAEKNRLRISPVFASRGVIYDREGKQLVQNIPVFDLVLTPAYLPQSDDGRNNILKKIGDISNKSAAELEQEVFEQGLFSFDPVIIEEGIEWERILEYENLIKDLPGMSLEKNLRRHYIDGDYFSTIIGYVGRMDKESLEKFSDYFLTEIAGKSGLELQYENILRTMPGKKVTEIDAFGKIIKTDKIEESKDIKSIALSIDFGLQKKLYDEISAALKRVNAKKGAGVAIDPRNGQILALVSLPSYDNNLLSKGISQEEYKNLFNSPIQPFFNRAVSGQYPPGSTIKPFIAAAALEEKIAAPNKTIVDNGALVIPNQYNPEIVYRFPDWKTHGPVNVYSAIAQSCDVYFYQVGGGYGDLKGLGFGRIVKYLTDFGFGAITGIDLPNEKSGFIPSATWKKEETGEDWYIGDTYHLSIGQGYITATPLQMAVLTAAVANGGIIWQPKIVDKIVDSDKNTIEEISAKSRKIGFISKENLDIIKRAMRETVVSGSAQYLKSLPVAVAGKTGTAQVSLNEPTNAWFVSFAPYENPEIVLVILAEGGGEGSSTAVPAAKEVLEWYFKR